MLNADDLMEQAARRTGHTDYGDFPLRDGLDVLGRAILAEAGLNDAGMTAAREELVGLLAIRLEVEASYRADPGIATQRVIAPIMVMGLPRSGTTALSQMLSQDPANRSIRRWEAAAPTPPPHPATDARDPRLVDMQSNLDRRYALTPKLMAMNPVAAGDPTENLCFLRLTLRSQHFAGFYHVPSYTVWLGSVEMKPSYQYLLRVLKLLQANYSDVRWNLKYPFDLFWLNEIAEVFPDARIVWTHRDPVKTVPSTISLISALREPFVEHVDKLGLARIQLELLAELAQRGLQYRRRADALPIVDLYNVDLVRDPNGTIRALYGTLGIPYTDAFDQALRSRNAERPKGKFGTHRYSPADYGLDERDIVRRFEFYTAALKVPLEAGEAPVKAGPNAENGMNRGHREEV
jgi:hypothetical protein